MVARDVQMFKVTLVGLHFAPIDEVESHADEDLLDFFDRAREDVPAAQMAVPPGQGDVQGLLRPASHPPDKMKRAPVPGTKARSSAVPPGFPAAAVIRSAGRSTLRVTVEPPAGLRTAGRPPRRGPAPPPRGWGGTSGPVRPAGRRSPHPAP